MRQQLYAYLSELAGTAIMMAIGVGAIALFWAPGSPVPRIDPERLRLLATGLDSPAARRWSSTRRLGERAADT